MGGNISEKLFRSIILLILLSAVQSISASEYPDFIGYVNDYAHILSGQQASALDQELRDFDNRTTIEVAVVTVDSIGSKNPQDYAIDLANYWGIGKRDKNNGIIILVAMQSHDIWIEVGTGISGQFSSSEVQKIVDNVIIPQFRAGRPDLGIINGVHSIISSLESSATSQTSPSSTSSTRDENIEKSSLLKFILYLILFALVAIISAFGITSRSKAKKNTEKITELRTLYNQLIEREAVAMEALNEMKANYVPSVWKSAENAFNFIDFDSIELRLLRAEKLCNRGFIFARSAQSRIKDAENSLLTARTYVEFPIDKLAEAKKANQECKVLLAGLDAAFSQAEIDNIGDQISMTTRMNLEAAKHVYEEASALAKQPDDTVDWIMLLGKLEKVKADVEQFGKDSIRDQAIAEKLKGQDPGELLAKMRQTMDQAEKILGSSDAARPDLEEARNEYERVRDPRHRDERMNEIDLYLILSRINEHIKQGHTHDQDAQERAEAEEHVRYRESDTESFSGGHMGGGSHGGGRSSGGGGGRMGGGSHGGGKW